MKIMKSIYIFTLIFGLSAFSACNSSVNTTNRESNDAGSGQSAENLSANSKISNTAEKVEEVEPTKTEQTSELPKFEKQEDYRTSVRQKLLKAGWTPAASEEGKENCLGQESLCREIPELEAGPSSPFGQAIMRWQKGDKVLLVRTIDSFLYDSYEYEKPKKTQSIPNVEGKYVYKSKHEYGEDSFTWELKKGNVATYVSEREGGDGADLKGTWKLDEGENTVIVSFPAAPDGAETYVFKLDGRNLKMIKEPKLGEGTVGFTGTIFKRQ